MSANIEKADTIPRVTRASLRKMNSSDSLNLDPDRPETPTGRIRNTKKLDSIDEAVLTPTRRGTRAVSAQRNLLAEESITPSSPLRRTTRRMSSESKEAVASPARMTRSKRPSISESEDEVIFIPDPTVRAKPLMKNVVVKLEEVIEEQPEQETEQESNEKSAEATSDNLIDLSKSIDSTNELELRNRSISKSPCVAQRTSISSNDVTSVHDNSNSMQNDNSNSMEVSNVNSEEIRKSKSPSKSPKKKSWDRFFEMATRDSDSSTKSLVIHKSLSSIVESSSSNSISASDESCSPQKSVIKESIEIMTQVKDVETPKKSLLDKLKSPLKSANKENGSKNRLSQGQKINSPKNVFRSELENTVVDEKEVSINSRDSGISTKENEYASFKENDAPQNNGSEELVSKMMQDFIPETAKESNIGGQTDVPLKKTLSLIDKTQIIPTDMAIESESEEEESIHNETNKQVTDMDLTNFLEHKNSDLAKKNSNTWNLTVRGSSKQIDTLKEPEKEIIHETSAKKQRKVISSDESESENERNPFIDDEAEVADSDIESLTKSERDYLEQNEIPEDGESIGSQDSEQLGEEEEEYESDSFIDQNEDISDTYSLDSNEKLLEEEELNNSQKKRKSRIIPQFSSSEDEAPKSAESPEKVQELPEKVQESPEKIQLSTKNSRESLNGNSSGKSEDQSPMKTQSAANVRESSQSAADSDNSPVKTQKTAKKGRKSLDIQALSEHTSNKNQQSAKKSRLSLPLIQEHPQNADKLIETQQSVTKVRKSVSKIQDWTVSDNKIENENEQNMSSAISSTNSCDSLNKTNSSLKESGPEEKSCVRKRKREVDDENSATKRFREMSPNETEALHMDDQSNLIENDGDISMDEISTQKPSKEVKGKKEKKVVETEEQSSGESISDDPVKVTKKKTVDINTLLERCNEYMEKTKEEKKAKMALKKERKAKKLEKKKLQNDENQVQENLDSSNGENKENASKKKKKSNKKKKQQLLDEIDDLKKDDMSSKLDKLQQKLNLKRQRKKEKKLAKLAQQKEANLMETTDDITMSEKSIKTQSNETKPLKISSKHVLKVQEEPLEIDGEEKIKKKAKKQKETEKLPQEDVKVKKSKKTTEVNEFPQKVQSVPIQHEIEKKKPKKRPITEVVDDNDTETVEKPKAKKKLNILKQVESSTHVLGQKKFANQDNNADSFKYPSNLSSKLNQIIPKGLGNDEKPPSKKKSSQKKVIDAQKVPSKRPIRTTAGTFIEESIMPYTFKSTEYKPINVGSSSTTKYGVVAFSAKKKSSGPSVVDFKMQAMMKRNKNRDKSIKNLKNLM